MQYELLKTSIEQSIGYKVKIPRDFKRLSELIFNRTHELISESTLKRLWGYVNGDIEPRISTLDILSQFIGYTDFEQFRRLVVEPAKNGNDATTPTSPSNIILGECIFTDDMNVGDTYRLTWAPGRVCDIKYQGDNSFVVIASELTRLVVGSTFRCSVFEKGCPLFINQLYFSSDQIEPVSYVAGKIGGIHIEKI